MYATATEDMDALTFRTPKLLRRFTSSQGKEKQPIIEVDFAVMLTGKSAERSLLNLLRKLISCVSLLTLILYSSGRPRADLCAVRRPLHSLRMRLLLSNQRLAIASEFLNVDIPAQISTFLPCRNRTQDSFAVDQAPWIHRENSSCVEEGTVSLADIRSRTQFGIICTLVTIVTWAVVSI